MKVVKFDNEVVSCTCDDQMCTESLINSNAGTLDLTGSGMKRGRRRHRRRRGTRFFESEDPVRIDLSGDTGSHVEKIKNCCPESKTPRTGSGDPQRFVLTDGGGRLEAAARRLWDVCEEYIKLDKLDRDPSSSPCRPWCWKCDSTIFWRR